jgi:NitT/TauT family transport system substrate-binding protein
MRRRPPVSSAAVFAGMLALAVGGAPGCGRQPQSHGEVTIRFGVLPVPQALGFFAAADGGDFAAEGVKVELVPFDTAAEKDIALAAGQIDGYFGDLFTPLVVRGNGVDCRIVAVNYDTREDRRMFAVLGRPGGGYTSARQLAGVPVAISSNSVIHYVTETLLRDGGLVADQFAVFESKNIGLRFQMLMSGQLEAATLPEPLATAAIAGGATLVADDRGVPASQTVLVFRQAFLTDHRGECRRFLRAVSRAQRRLADDPRAARTVMVAHVRLPEALQASFPVPVFPLLASPDRTTVATVTAWLRERGVLTADVAYGDVVDFSLLD